jgi:hypothetical protein
VAYISFPSSAITSGTITSLQSIQFHCNNHGSIFTPLLFTGLQEHPSMAPTTTKKFPTQSLQLCGSCPDTNHSNIDIIPTSRHFTTQYHSSFPAHHVPAQYLGIFRFKKTKFLSPVAYISFPLQRDHFTSIHSIPLQQSRFNFSPTVVHGLQEHPSMAPTTKNNSRRNHADFAAHVPTQYHSNINAIPTSRHISRRNITPVFQSTALNYHFSSNSMRFFWLLPYTISLQLRVMSSPRSLISQNRTALPFSFFFRFFHVPHLLAIFISVSSHFIFPICPSFQLHGLFPDAISLQLSGSSYSNFSAHARPNITPTAQHNQIIIFLSVLHFYFTICSFFFKLHAVLLAPIQCHSNFGSCLPHAP